MAKKIRRKCYMCGDPMRYSVRYKPADKNGRYVFCCPECAEEAKRGKYGYENKRFYYGDVSYFNGEVVRIG